MGRQAEIALASLLHGPSDPLALKLSRMTVIESYISIEPKATALDRKPKPKPKPKPQRLTFTRHLEVKLNGIFGP
jgi:hypothetical protein